MIGVFEIDLSLASTIIIGQAMETWPEPTELTILVPDTVSNAHVEMIHRILTGQLYTPTITGYSDGLLTGRVYVWPTGETVQLEPSG